MRGRADRHRVGRADHRVRWHLFGTGLPCAVDEMFAMRLKSHFGLDSVGCVRVMLDG